MEYRGNQVCLSVNKFGELIDEKNTIDFEDRTFQLKYLSEDFKGSKGGNSNVFRLYDKENPEREKAIKICNLYDPERKTKSWHQKNHGRFINEISALTALRGRKNIVQIEFNDKIPVDGKYFPYYVMEKADLDLKDYFLSKKEVTEQDKVLLCIDIFNALFELHEQGYYHRDIKPDNILLFETEEEKATWKIGDLGLINHRDTDYDNIGEKIGPFGWLSPEATNKFLTEKAGIGFDCKIDDKSDIFQMGKLFWFIFQLNIPVGQIELNDFICIMKHKKDAYDMIKGMLSYDKGKRADKEIVSLCLNDLGRKYAVV